MQIQNERDIAAKDFFARVRSFPKWFTLGRDVIDFGTLPDGLTLT